MSIFESKEQMPPKDISPDVVRTAMTPAEVHHNYMPATMPHRQASVENIQRPRRGHDY
jgi:hypothetical protein